MNTPTTAPHNPALAAAMRELRRGSATTPVPSGKAYRRTVKHSKRDRDDA